jgi:hypothetical protein
MRDSGKMCSAFVTYVLGRTGGSHGSNILSEDCSQHSVGCSVVCLFRSICWPFVERAQRCVCPKGPVTSTNSSIRVHCSFFHNISSLLFLQCRLLRRADVVDAGDVSDAANRHLDIFYTGE